MGWQLHCRIVCERTWSEEDLRRLRELQRRWDGRIQVCSGLDLSGLPATRDLRTSAQPPPTGEDFAACAADEPDLRDFDGPLSAAIAADFGTMVAQLRELEAAFPGARASISDECVLEGHTPVSALDVGRYVSEVRAQLEADGVDEGTEGPDDEPGAEAFRRHQLERLRPLLESAQADFARWKNRAK